MTEKLNLGVLISGGGSNLQAIIDACENSSIHGKIVFVGSDNPEAKGLERAKKHGIPWFVVDYDAKLQQANDNSSSIPDLEALNIDHLASSMMTTGRNQDAERLKTLIRKRMPAEAALLDHMARYPFDLLVLAGFMRMLTPYFIDKVNTPPGSLRIMNIHPALLPAFPGVDGYGDTFRYGCKVGGCTVHFIDYGEDTGPIIGQASFEIAESDDLKAIRKKGLAIEWQLYPKCIQYAAERRLRVEQKTYRQKNGEIVQRAIVKILPKPIPDIS